MFGTPGSRSGRKRAKTSGEYIQPNIYTSTQTITIPANVTRAFVRMVGGGGGSDNNTTTKFSGGGGGYLEKTLTGLVPGNTLSLTIGAGGAVGANGGNSTLASGTQIISTLTANGGLTANHGGTATGGDLNITGGNTGSMLSPAAGQLGSSTLYGGGGYWTGCPLVTQAGAAGGCIIQWFT